MSPARPTPWRPGGADPASPPERIERRFALPRTKGASRLISRTKHVAVAVAVAVVAGFVVVAGTAATVARAGKSEAASRSLTGSARGGWIAYQRDGSVRLIRPDGSGDHVLTASPEGEQQHPDWSGRTGSRSPSTSTRRPFGRSTQVAGTRVRSCPAPDLVSSSRTLRGHLTARDSPT